MIAPALRGRLGLCDEQISGTRTRCRHGPGPTQPRGLQVVPEGPALVGRVSTDAVLRTLATRLGNPEVRYTLWRLFPVEQRAQQQTAEATKAAADISRARALSSLVQALEA